MRAVVTRFFKFDALNTIPEVYNFAIGIYVALVIISWFSVFSKDMDMGWLGKMFWFMMVTFIPIVGLALYCVYCLYIADYSYLRRFGLAGRH